MFNAKISPAISSYNTKEPTSELSQALINILCIASPNSFMLVCCFTLFKYLQIFSASCDAFSHGANDVDNDIGPFVNIYTI